MKLSLFSFHRWRNGGRVKSFHWRQTTLLNGGARRIRNQDVWFQSPYFFYYIISSLCLSNTYQLWFPPIEKRNWWKQKFPLRKELKFSHSNSQEAVGIGFTNPERKKKERKKEKTEIAYSLREEKVINYIKVMEPSPRCNPQWKGTSTLW